MRWPRTGAPVCPRHGGHAPQVERARERRIKEQNARAAVGRLDLSRKVDPVTALLEEIYRTAGVVAWLDEKVRALNDKEMVWGKTEEVHKSSGEHPGTDTKYAAERNVWVQFWQDERAHLVRVCREAITAGIEERMVRLAEQEGALVADVLRRALDALYEALVRLGMADQLVEEWPRLVAEIVPRELRALTAEAAS